MSKDKKKKDKAGKGTGARLKALAENPVVADLVAAALVSTAAALKDPKKARAMAGDAQDELTAMARETSKKGTAMWKLALEVGRQALDTLVGEAKGAKTARKAAKASGKPKTARKTGKASAKPPRKAVKATTEPTAKVARKSVKVATKPAAKTTRKTTTRSPRKPASKGTGGAN